MPRRAEIDLLFGLLALQNGLIDQAALFAGFAAWVRERDRGMAEILAGQGRLDARDRPLIDGLVDRHLERHGGDAARSLSALRPAASVRRAIERLGDPELQASLPPEPAPGRGGEDPFRTIPPPDGDPGPGASSRFRVVRELAGGGLGRVFVARDAELDREVALKEIREKYADEPHHRARFEFEARITGGLEHPGIVPVYGLGARADGRPYYAMRLIRGASLKEALDDFHREAAGRGVGSRGLPLRRFLRHFLDVCNAIEYAHQRGVIHRDLKPSNVMLGKHGETLVVDWGLAKAVGRPGATPPDEGPLSPMSASGSSETLPGSAVGTPGYMSPEQAGGESHRFGPLVDVYGLGATLYTVLTGRPPFDDPDRYLLLEKVRTGRFASPRAHDGSIDPALEAICLKAMATAPEERYPSARALADDVERWMADEPVTARRDPPAIRAARWVRRHRTLAAGAAIALVVAAGASAVAAVLVARQRDRAEANLGLARGVVDRMYLRVAEQLEGVPWMDDYQRTVLENARAFYEGEAIPQRGDRATRLGAAEALIRLADVDGKLDRLAEAREAADRAMELYRSAGDGPDPARGLARAEAMLGRIGARSRRYEDAAGHFLRSAGHWEELARVATPSPGEVLEQGEAWRGRGEALLRMLRLGEAEEALRRALALADRVAAERPDDPSARASLADALDDLAGLETERNRDAESERLRARAIGLRRAALAARPSDPRARCALAWGLGNLGYSLLRLGRASDADAALRESIERSGRILEDHPDPPASRIELSRALAHRAELMLLVGRPAEAIDAYRRAVDVLRAGRDDPPEARARLAAVLHDLAKAEQAVGRLDDAEAHLRDCLRIVGAGPGDRPTRLLQGQAWLLSGMIARDRGRAGEAIEAFGRALGAFEGVRAEAPDDPQARGLIVAALVEGLGKTYRGLGRRDDAEASYGRAADLLASMEHKDSTDLYNLACCLAQSPSAGDRAVEALRRAFEGEGCDLATVVEDSDLEPLRGRDDFRLLLMDMAFPADPFAP